MKLMLAGSLVLIVALGQTASGQETPAANANPATANPATNPVASPATAPAAEAPADEPNRKGTYTLAEGTDVQLQFAQDLSSSTSFEDDPVMLTLVKDLKVGDVVVAKAGSKA
jgi:hypothetical protein